MHIYKQVNFWKYFFSNKRNDIIERERERERDEKERECPKYNKNSKRKATLIALLVDAPWFYLKKVCVGRSQNKEDGTTSEQFQMRLISIKYVYKYDTYGNPCHLVDSLCHSWYQNNLQSSWAIGKFSQTIMQNNLFHKFCYMFSSIRNDIDCSHFKEINDAHGTIISRYRKRI